MSGPPAAEIVRQLIQSTRVASLGTLVVPESAEDNGMPFVSLVTVAAVGPSQLAMLLRTAFLASHPSAQMYAGFGNFAFHVFDIEQAHLVAGFGRIQTLTPSQWS